MPLLELINVSKTFAAHGRRSEVLRDINLTIEEGEFVAIVGYSGAGKTTLISMIAGLTRATSGSVTLKGLEVTEPGPDRGVCLSKLLAAPVDDGV